MFPWLVRGLSLGRLFPSSLSISPSLPLRFSIDKDRMAWGMILRYGTGKPKHILDGDRLRLRREYTSTCQRMDDGWRWVHRRSRYLSLFIYMSTRSYSP